MYLRYLIGYSRNLECFRCLKIFSISYWRSN